MRKILVAVVALVAVAVCGRNSDAQQWVNVGSGCPNGICPLSQNVQPQVTYSQAVYTVPAANAVTTAPARVEYTYSQPVTTYSESQPAYQSQGVVNQSGSNQYVANQNSGGGRTWFRGFRFRR